MIDIDYSMGSAAKVHTLRNGLTVALERLPHLHSASAGIWIRTGSADEGPEESGLAHFLEHLFFKGTTTRTTRQIMEAVENRGGHLNAFTSREYTCLYVQMLSNDIEIGVQVLADILNNSLFNDFEKERSVITEEIASIEDTPDEYVFDLLAASHWPHHPLGRSISGSVESVSNLTRDHVQAFYDAWYVPGEMVFSIAGNFDEEAVLRQVTEGFETIPSRATPPRCDAPKFQGGVQPVPRDIGQMHLTLAFPAPALTEEKRFVCDLACNVLGGGSTSWLFEKIREEEGLAYAIHTFSSYHVKAGVLGIYAAVAQENLDLTLDLTCSLLRKLRDEGVGSEELEMNRRQMKGNLLMALERTSTRMSRMGKSLLYHGRIVPVEEIIASLDSVSPQMVQDFAASVFQPETCAITVLGPTNGFRMESAPL